MIGADHLRDTNVVTGLLKGHGPAVTLTSQAGLATGSVAVSQITRMKPYRRPLAGADAAWHPGRSSGARRPIAMRNRRSTTTVPEAVRTWRLRSPTHYRPVSITSCDSPASARRATRTR